MPSRWILGQVQHPSIHPMQQLQTYWCYWGGKWWGGGIYPLGLYVRLPQTGVFPRAYPSSSQSAASLL